MRKAFVHDVGRFSAGLMTGTDPRMLPPDAATASTNVDHSQGVLTGLYGYGDSVGSSGGTVRWIHHTDGVGWRAAAYKNFACFDSARMIGGTLTGISYYTANTAGAAAQPMVTAGNQWNAKALGVATNTISSITAGAASSRSYRITRAIQLDALNATWESNPSAAVSTANANGCTLNFSAAGTNSTGVAYFTNVYATAIGTTSGPYYYLGYVTSAATTYTDNAYGFGTTPILLNWDAGGTPSSALYKYDHGQSPSLYVLANALMGVSATPAGATQAAYQQARAGILFGAYYGTLYWSANGYPWYWPTLNAEDLDDIIEAIVVDRASAYVFTRSSVYLVTGSDDTALTITRTSAVHGCMVEGGPAVIQTPHGILYPTIDGIAVFDGQTSRLVTEGLLPTGFTSAWTYATGGYKDGLYIIAGSSSGYILDLQAWPQVRITSTRNNSNIKALTRVQPHATAGLDTGGLYVFDGADNNIKPWSPRVGGHNATRQVWGYTTGAITAGLPMKDKRFKRFWTTETGSTTYTVSCYNASNAQVGTVTLTGSGWLPASFTGEYLTVDIAPGAGATAQTGFRIEGDVYV